MSNCFNAFDPQIFKTNLPLLLVTAGVLIDRDGRVLLAQRPEGKSMAGLWEFPGGKIEDNETPEAALCRELKEELGIDTTPTCLHPLSFVSHAYDDFHMLMPVFTCRVWQGIATGREGQALTWVKPADIGQYETPPADLHLIQILQDL